MQNETDFNTSGSSSGSVGQQAKEQVQQVAGQAREKASQASEQARQSVRTQIDDRTSQAGIALHSNAQDLRTVGEELRKQGKETPARIADQIAERGERIAGYLRTNDSDRLLRDVEDFARRNPWAVIAGGLTLGFLASRFLRASGENRYTSTYTGWEASQVSTPQSAGYASALAGSSYETPAVSGTTSGVSYGTTTSGSDEYTSTRSTEELREEIRSSGATDESRNAVENLSGGTGGA